MQEQGKYFIKNYDLAHMSSYSNYPQSLLDSMRVKGLINPGGNEIRDPDINISAFALDPGTYYASHAHPFPEVYIFLGGVAECEWGDEEFVAEVGTVTHCPPNVSHAMRVISSESLRSIIISWAPNGDRNVWKTPSVLLDDSD